MLVIIQRTKHFPNCIFHYAGFTVCYTYTCIFSILGMNINSGPQILNQTHLHYACDARAITESVWYVTMVFGRYILQRMFGPKKVNTKQDRIRNWSPYTTGLLESLRVKDGPVGHIWKAENRIEKRGEKNNEFIDC